MDENKIDIDLDFLGGEKKNIPAPKDHSKKEGDAPNQVVSPYAQPPWKIILLSSVTFSFYIYFWFFKTWRSIKNFTGTQIKPGWRTFGLIIPLYNLYRIDTFFRHDIEMVRKEVGGYKYIEYPLLYGLAFILLWFIPNRLDGIYSLLSILCVIPIVAVQIHLNKYWKQAQPETTVNSSLSVGEIIVLILGTCITLLSLVGHLMGDA